MADAIAPSEAPAPDSWTTWTGSIVRQPDGVWRMFYTGTSREDAGQVQALPFPENLPQGQGLAAMIN